MADYDIYKTIICPIADSYEELFTTTNTIAIPIIEWNSTIASGFDMSNVATPTSTLLAEDRTQYFAYSLLENQEFSQTAVYVWMSGRNDPSYGLSYHLHGNDYTGNSSTIDARYWTICYDPTNNRTFVIWYNSRDSKYEYLRIVYYSSGYDYIGEVYTFSNFIPKAVNFYRTKDGEYNNDPISLNRGESSEQLTFDIVFEYGAIPYSGEVLYEPSGDNSFTIESNIITALETATRYETLITARPADYPEVYTFIELLIPDNLGPYGPGGFSKPEGGDGSFGDADSDNIIGDLPNGSSESDVSSAGLFTRYVMSTSTIRSFGDWLFTDNIIDTVVKEFMALIFASPMEAIISMISYPFSIGSLPGIATAASNVFYGNKDSGIASLGRLTNGFAKIDWGTVAIDEYWGNFLDYSPHTKIELYLPWSTGFVDLDPNEVMNNTISIVTNIELDKGTCIHNVYNGRGTVIGQYSGVCGKQLPITALDTSGKALSAVVAATAVAVSAGAAGITAAGAAATESAAVGALRGAKAAGLSIEGQLTAVDSMRSIMSKFHKDYTPVAKSASKVAAVSAIAAARVPPHIQRSGSFTGNGSGMGVQYPYFILSRPDQSVPDQYGAYVGYPSNIYSSLGALSGYTEVGSIFLDGIACTENERAEIDALLKGGVIL